MNPQNVGKMEHPDSTATEGSPACGDQVTIYLKVDEASKVIEDVEIPLLWLCFQYRHRFHRDGNGKSKTLDEAKKITWRDAMEALDGCPR